MSFPLHRTCAAAALTLALGAPLHAQGRGPLWPGDRVRVWMADAPRQEGIVLEISGDTALVHQDGRDAPLTVLLSSARRIDVGRRPVRRSSAFWRGARIGAVAGAALGAIVGSALCEACGPPLAVGMAAPIAHLGGTLETRTRWERVPPALHTSAPPSPTRPDPVEPANPQTRDDHVEP